MDEYNCTICKKTFKNEGSWNQHLQSKKHKQAASKVRADLCFDEETETIIKEKAKEEKKEQKGEELEEVELDSEDLGDLVHKAKKKDKKKKN